MYPSNTVYVSLLVVDVLEELLLVWLSWGNCAVLSDGLLKFTVDLELGEGDFFVGTVRQVEDASVVLVCVALPHAASLADEVLLDVHVPVFVFAVELEVVSLGHVIDSEDTVVAVHGKILNGGDWGGHHLLKVVNFIHMLSFTPEAVGTIDEHEILVTVVNHLAHVVEVDVLQESED